MLFMIMKAEINKLIYILFIPRYYIIPEFFMYLAFIILGILEFIKLHSCKFGLIDGFSKDVVMARLLMSNVHLLVKVSRITVIEMANPLFMS